ncbi:MAG: bifunctional glutamate N-acetyltransferase/amino-acid acetyltransferase ArgJ [Spirochaetaceae bacterium]|nr:bifunctional glutamate N-acetyltransferase/amino-acid acetyltransferase ArgJ [Spirochaetaceae bacterium]MCF7948640.1 bifunctional glutamate N-acetyltransferase/amino-acid acetyltransferase ArgJ [Spirochaetia bacterium]MCF7950700.1 bifunctional glutamate N-acetyltransferase/amino-acid acetyltransferase ArgJ [Spirochaetaceae bacterium]
MKQVYELPQGFSAAGFSGNIKTEGLDMALLLSDRPAASAGVFTKNRVAAACIDWNRELCGNPMRAVLINSGNANACTGARGMQDNRRLAADIAGGFGIDPEQVFIASTGVIGVPLPIEKMARAVSALPQSSAAPHSSPESLERASRAIMTTDLKPKVCSYSFAVGDKTVRITGMAKGSGMIHPNMATMLGFITTDVEIQGPLLQHLLQNAVDDSFNMISVDGDTSTNDMVLSLANGASGVQITSPDGRAWQEFKEGLNYVARELAIMIARDGEGATKLISAIVEGALTLKDARTLARGVVSSNLVKAAFFGEDANWGRVLAAMGYSGGAFNPRAVDILFRSEAGEVLMMESAAPMPFDEEKAAAVLAADAVEVIIRLYEGTGMATAWGCDLTYEYVKINGSYRT